MKSKSPSHRVFIAFWISLAFLISHSSKSEAYTVSAINSEYHNGQVFLTWTTPNVKNLQYNVYRSVLPLLLSSQLTSSALLGFVRDSSSKNIFWSQQSDENIFYKITDNGSPLTASKGLYVVTCTDNLLYYYVVTVTNLSNGNEDKTISVGGNSTLLPVADVVAKPMPVWQDSIIAHNDEAKQLYVQFVNNQETALYPAMNSTGSYGFNFFIVKRGTATKYPLFVLFEGSGNMSTESVNLDEAVTDCYVMGIFDWLPIPQDDGKIGDNTYFCCYHEKFNIYSNTNPIPTSGIVKTYPQKRYWEGIKWLESKVNIDTTRIYLKGTSANGYGALITANISSEKIAAVYAMVEPTSVGAASSITKQMWGEGSSKLNTDVLQWNTGVPIPFTVLKDQFEMVDINASRSMPLIYDVHGKKDNTVAWNDSQIKWFDSLENNHLGGTWYWDGRDHSQNKKDFAPEETEPDYYRYATNISYPAFSNCTIDQDPGNGSPSNGDDYGALNGYLDWEDSNISDKKCNYTIHVFIKDFYVGGVLDPEQYSTCKTDITFRRLQKFLPAIGSTIKWSNFDEVTDNKIQNGSFTYSGELITIPGLTVTKTGNRIKLTIKNCTSRIEGRDALYEMGDEVDDVDGIDEDQLESQVSFSGSPDGYIAHIDLKQNENTQLQVFDLLGRMIWEKNAALVAGPNSIEIPSPGKGIFLITVRGASISAARKLAF